MVSNFLNLTKKPIEIPLEHFSIVKKYISLKIIRRKREEKIILKLNYLYSYGR